MRVLVFRAGNLKLGVPLERVLGVKRLGSLKPYLPGFLGLEEAPVLDLEPLLGVRSQARFGVKVKSRGVEVILPADEVSGFRDGQPEPTASELAPLRLGDIAVLEPDALLKPQEAARASGDELRWIASRLEELGHRDLAEELRRRIA